ncbi:hypothetical protein ITJ64_03560 [Herbiconiux sp. VKM Ac-1786]|uniref:DUF6578 domain-containing protein n=1 Tax=Herbiconiux sp. VKM Ac-1786 TaxID=2783824 RepID=UPI00188B4504|nr:DUF6578 domain-containing protein [Herbiconiux sp. VKM Ac-1786]MBF4571584.1 hypothetical protein [Herbiconiux sp. VKM Ac-1786]
MLIEVVVPGWEHACCGEAFAVGDAVAFRLHAAPPADAGTVGPGGPHTGLPRFVEEHHGQTPEDVPQWEVPGRVVAIEAVEYGRRERPGQPRVFEWDEQERSAHPLDTVAARAQGPDEYLVTVQVDDGAALPEYRRSVEDVTHERLRLEAIARADRRAADPVGLRLGALADLLEEHWGEAGVIGRSSTGANLSFTPHRPGAALSWSRSDAADDAIGVALGGGRFGLGADDDGVRMLEAFVEAAATGRVQERVRETPEGVEFTTEVLGDHGVLDRAIRTANVFRSGGFMAIGGPVRERLERGDHRWAPWGGGEPR